MTLSFTWWGNDVRHAITEELIAAFEAEHENITIEPQYTDWAGYWDKLATTVAAGDTPDIIQMDEKQLSTYAANGVLLDLGDSRRRPPDRGLPGGGARHRRTRRRPVRRARGHQLVHDHGQHRPARRASASTCPTTRPGRGTTSPSIAAEVTEASGGAVVGSQSWGFEDGGLNNWLRQHGESLYNDRRRGRRDRGGPSPRGGSSCSR